MFGKMKDAMQQLQWMQKLMKDENFRAFLSHPKVQVLLQDHEFLKKVQEAGGSSVAMSDPKLSQLAEDPDLRQLMSKIDFAKFF